MLGLVEAEVLERNLHFSVDSRHDLLIDEVMMPVDSVPAQDDAFA